GVAEGGGAAAPRREHAVDLHDPADEAEVEVPGGGEARRQHEPAAAGVVGHGVDEADLPVGDAAVDDLEAGKHGLGGGQRVGHGHPRPFEGPAEEEGDLQLDAGGDQGGRGHGAAVGDGHRGQEVAVVGLVDAELGLHGQAGEADLAADD